MNQQNSTIRLKSEMKGFEDAFNCLPKNQILPIRQELMRDLDWSLSVFYYKKRGDTPIWEHEVPVIESIFLRFNIDVRTEKPIQTK